MDNRAFDYSQNALSTYTSCQLKFRRRYLDALYWPRPITGQVELGQSFHILCQRYFTSGQHSCEGQLHKWMDLIVKFRPPDTNQLFLPEQELRYRAEGLRLVAKYDLLVLSDTERVFIYDWKTEKRQHTESYLEKTFQTCIYRFLMARAGNPYWEREIKPSDIVMVYWNPRFPESPVTLAYNEKQYRRDESRLRQIISGIEGKDRNSFWPTTEEKVCRTCEYAPLCEKGTTATPSYQEEEDISLGWDDIEDIR
jgi:hypothetical protein